MRRGDDPGIADQFNIVRGFMIKYIQSQSGDVPLFESGDDRIVIQ